MRMDASETDPLGNLHALPERHPLLDWDNDRHHRYEAFIASTYAVLEDVSVPRSATRAYPGSSILPSLGRSTAASDMSSVPPRSSPIPTPPLSNGSTTRSSTNSSHSAIPSAASSSIAVSTTDSTTPSAHYHHPTVLFPCHLRLLPCPFLSPSESDWKTHSRSHFHPHPPPTTTQCPLCATAFASPLPEPSAAWHALMDHMAQHHRRGDDDALAAPDFALYEYLWRRDIVTAPQLKEIKGCGRWGAEKGRGEVETYTVKADGRRDERRRRARGGGGGVLVQAFR